MQKTACFWPLATLSVYNVHRLFRSWQEEGKKKDFKEIFKSFQPGSSLKDVEWWISIFPCTAHTINTFVIRFIVKPYKLLMLGKLSFRVSFCYNVFKRWFIEKKKRKETLYKYNAKHYLLIRGCSSSGFWWDCIQINTFLHMMCELSSFFPSLHGAYLFVSAQRKKKKERNNTLVLWKLKKLSMPYWYVLRILIW